MREHRFRMFRNVMFELVPITSIIANCLTRGTYRQQASELIQFSLFCLP